MTTRGMDRPGVAGPNKSRAAQEAGANVPTSDAATFFVAQPRTSARSGARHGWAWHGRDRQGSAGQDNARRRVFQCELQR
jgi:hypothetical protein